MQDENEPKRPEPFTPGQPLDDLSVEEIDHLIAILESEIERLKSAREDKRKHLDAASALFSRP